MLQIVLRQTIVVPFSENNRYTVIQKYMHTNNTLQHHEELINVTPYVTQHAKVCESCLYFIDLSKRPRYFQQVTRGKSRAMWPAVDWSAFFQIERWGGGRPSNTTGTARASSCSQGFLGFDPKWNPQWEKQRFPHPVYPLVMTNIAMENGHRNSGFTQLENGDFP